MFVKIESIYLYTADIDRSSHFYKTLLGLKMVARGESSAEFDLGGDRLGIMQLPPSIPQGWEGPLIFLEVEDIERAVNRLRELGVQTQGEINTVPGFEDTRLKVSTFYDPDGNVLHLVERQHDQM